MPHRLILGLETSCDETAAAVVQHNSDGTGKILSSVVLSQLDEHAPFGGVVPEIAARAHVEALDGIIAEALKQADIRWPKLDAVAATAGPGLIGGVLVGLTTAKAIALAHDIPLLAINHLEGHALTVGLTDNIRPPYLLLLISGGHTQLLGINGLGQYHRYGTTIDDALGEAFDKTAKLLGLGFPGGPAVERAALGGNPARFDLPRPLLGREGCDFSFSGLKTALRRVSEASAPLSDTDIADLCASFQAAICEIIADRVVAAMTLYRDVHKPHDHAVLVAAGGVAANQALRTTLKQCCSDNDFALIIPPAELCTDNAVMIAWAGAQKLADDHTDPLDAPARARWPLGEPLAAVPGTKPGAI